MSRSIALNFVPVFAGLWMMAALPASAGEIQNCGMDMTGDVSVSAPETFAQFCSGFSFSSLGALATLTSGIPATLTSYKFDFTVSSQKNIVHDVVTMTLADFNSGLDDRTASFTMTTCSATMPIVPALQNYPLKFTTGPCSDSGALNFLQSHQSTGFTIGFQGNDPGNPNGGSDTATFSTATFTPNPASGVPEPTTIASVMTGLGLLLMLRRRQRRY